MVSVAGASAGLVLVPALPPVWKGLLKRVHFVGLHAVLFDVGGPLNLEVEHERRFDAAIRAELAQASYPVDDTAYADACRWAVEVFAPNTYQAIVWRLSGWDAATATQIYARVVAGTRTPVTFELRSGMAGVLKRLHADGLRLGLAANQPASALSQLDAVGIGRFFQHREVSGTSGLYKPDVRVFLQACAALDVPPEQCAMVGDRIDCDIAPARSLGMYAVRFQTGRHAAQQPRSWEETPHAVVHDAAELEACLTAPGLTS